MKSLLAASGLLLLAVLAAACTTTNTPNATNIAMEVTDSGCTPNRIETDRGTIINVAVRNTTSAPVTFGFAEENYSVNVPAGQTVTANFVAPTNAGNYPFTCGTTTGEIHVR
jgi:hypothetical protein